MQYDPASAHNAEETPAEEEGVHGEESTFEEQGPSETQEEEKQGRWQEGEELTFVRVRFPGNSRSFPFLIGKRHFGYGQKVLAMSDRGMDVGYINSFPYNVKFDKSLLPIRSISKVADSDDLGRQKENAYREREAFILCNDMIERLQLDMVITHVESMQFGKKIVLYFTAPARIDFRELVKDLVGHLRARVELRQISVRDRAASLGSIGPCGLATCCSSFLKSYGHVSIKMAKNQNLALIPSKLNGVCGQIKCCIKYEDDVYTDKRKRLPKEGSMAQLTNGDRGKVTRVHVLLEQFEMLTDKGQFRRYSVELFDRKTELPADWQFPREFDNIVHEQHQLITTKIQEAAPIKKDDDDTNSFLSSMKERFSEPEVYTSSDDDDSALDTSSVQDNAQDSEDQEQEPEASEKAEQRPPGAPGTGRRRRRRGGRGRRPGNSGGGGQQGPSST
jgi:cell fate regulator YaaT (PSP1 superfamily)